MIRQASYGPNRRTFILQETPVPGVSVQRCLEQGAGLSRDEGVRMIWEVPDRTEKNMEHILHATFANTEDGVQAVASLLYHGVRAEEINLILPQPQDIEAASAGVLWKAEFAVHSTSEGTATLSTAFVSAAAIVADALLPEPPQLTALFRRTALRHYDEIPETPGAPGYRYDALGAVIPDRSPTKVPNSLMDSTHTVVADTEQSAGPGLVFGRLTAMSIPGIGLVVGSGAIAVGLIAAGAVAGGLAGGIYGYLINRGIDPEVARRMSDHLAGGGTILSVSSSDAIKETEITLILKAFGGHLIRQSEHLNP
ncbi:MAG: hypothetical protein JWL77_6162 [Chthonomonadaceae bacterium]|nr:hypothetical protein [Chthonomonadaceae bacterium]